MCQGFGFRVQTFSAARPKVVKAGGYCHRINAFPLGACCIYAQLSAFYLSGSLQDRCHPTRSQRQRCAFRDPIFPVLSVSKMDHFPWIERLAFEARRQRRTSPFMSNTKVLWCFARGSCHPFQVHVSPRPHVRSSLQPQPQLSD